MEDKRKLRRVVLPLVVEFRPTYGAREFTPGVVKNISFSGLTIESYFSFIQYENLDIKLYMPQGIRHFSLNGDIVWKKQTGTLCQAGIHLKKPDLAVIKTLRGELSSFIRCPADAPGTVSP